MRPRTGRITKRQREILELIAEGHRTDAISAILDLSVFRVKDALREARLRLGARTVYHALAIWFNGGAPMNKYNRVGRLFISDQVSRDFHVEALRGCVVLRAEYVMARRGFEVDIDHPDLPEKEPGRMSVDLLAVMRDGASTPCRIAFQSQSTGEMYYTDAKAKAEAADAADATSSDCDK